MKRKRENCREESGKCPRANTLVFRCIGVGADNCHMLTVSVSDSDIIIIIIIVITQGITNSDLSDIQWLQASLPVRRPGGETCVFARTSCLFGVCGKHTLPPG